MHRYALTAILMILVILFRFVGSFFIDTMPNFQPLAALFFCGAIMEKNSRSWLIPLIAWMLSYPAPAIIQGNGHYLLPFTMLITLVAFAATFLLGKAFMNANFIKILGGSLLAALSFHLITNSLEWLISPLYAKSLSGLWQSLWLGPVGSEIPSWVFLRNMMAANALFTTIFFSSRIVLPHFLPRKLQSFAR